MAVNDDKIALAWASFKPVKAARQFFQAVGKGQPMHGPMVAMPGTRRFHYDDRGDLFSYKMLLGLRGVDEHGKYVLINADGPPTHRTRAHQREQRNAAGTVLVRFGIRYGLVPFTALRQARIDPRAVRILDRTDDTIETFTRQVKGKPRQYQRHFLGELLFRVDENYWLSGLDRNDNPHKGMYYLCQLPGAVKTVQEAFESLRPREVSQWAPRQGEWFFVGVGKLPKFRKAEVVHRVPITHADPAKQREGLLQAAFDRATRHVATDMVIRDDGVYVRRTIKDEEHDTLHLGKSWHRVVRNLAVVGYRYERGSGVKVD